VIGLSGRLRSSVIIGGQGIRARKLRTFLSMVSLFLGVLAVVVVQAGAAIAERSMLAGTDLQDGRDGTRQLYVPGDQRAAPILLDTLRAHPEAAGVANVNATVGEPSVTAVNPGMGSFLREGHYGGGEMTCDERGNCWPSSERPGAKAKPPGAAIELSLTAMTGDVRQFKPYRLVSGHWLSFTGPPSLSPRIVLNADAAKGFAEHRVPAELRIPGASAALTPRIVGVVDDGGYQPAAYVRADELANWLPGVLGGEGTQVLMSPGSSELERLLRAKLSGAGIRPGDLHVQVVENRKRAARELAILRWIFLGLAGLVLLIGVAGILNVGLATVGERIEEFALRRAVGTPRSLLAGIVLAETLLTGLLTAAAAIGTGAAALRIAAVFLEGKDPALRDLSFPWQAAVAGVAAGLIAGVLGGLVPALRAARIPIATVMRA
jgi:putative ABC transport system permease protein